MSKVTTLLKVGKQFINQDAIRAVARLGKQTKISLINGEEIVVKMDYDDVMSMLPPGKF